MNKHSQGLIYGVLAYVLWGVLPLYWKALSQASPYEILANRGIWALFFCIVILLYTKQIKNTLLILKNSRTLWLLAVASGFLMIGWGVYIWSVSENRIIESALGYYISPLFSVAIGVVTLGEKLRRLQWVAVAFASIGVVVLTFNYGSLPWIALALAGSWGLYSLIKKHLDLGSVETLSIETLIFFLPCAIYLGFLENKGIAQLGHGVGISLLLFFGGVVTIVPLLLFNSANTRLPLSTTGLLQYITPTMVFFIGIFVNHEDMSKGKFIGFIFIWVALIVLGRDLVKSGGASDNRIA